MSIKKDLSAMMKIADVKHYIQIGEEIFEVLDSKYSKIMKNYAYIKGKYVYVCEGKFKPGKPVHPGCVYIRPVEDEAKEGKYLWVKPESEEDKLIHSVKNISHFSTNQLLRDINDSSKFKAMVPEEVEKEEDLYAPKIKENDDIFKRIVKEAILRKKISLRQYRGKFKNDYDISNMRYALSKKDGPMSSKYFQKWAELLELDVEIRARFVNGEGEEDIIIEKLV
jgi:hypothetical protein